MTSLFSTSLFLLIAAITPGPNNLVVMRAAAHNGWKAALPAVAGVIAGGLVLLVVTTAGAGSAFSAWPWLRGTIKTGGVLYLIWLGARMIAAAGQDAGSSVLPAGLPGLFAFQFLNPKGWVMVLTVVAALPAVDAAHALLYLAPLFVCIPAACLLLWAGLGGALAPHLRRPVVRQWTDRVLGALLILAALLLFA
ncbi:MAG TPA: LysE family translocator [Rhodanobacteraceae bacterium]|nr:LysE family translocator [Rhodanobacteraceae bacterium]